MRTSRFGIKRGLATVAVSALAVTGIPFIAPAGRALLVQTKWRRRFRIDRRSTGSFASAAARE
jgi:hypothetical protein